MDWSISQSLIACLVNVWVRTRLKNHFIACKHLFTRDATGKWVFFLLRCSCRAQWCCGCPQGPEPQLIASNVVTETADTFWAVGETTYKGFQFHCQGPKCKMLLSPTPRWSLICLTHGLGSRWLPAVDLKYSSQKLRRSSGQMDPRLQFSVFFLISFSSTQKFLHHFNNGDLMVHNVVFPRSLLQTG